MVSIDKQYEFISETVGDLAKSTEDGLKLFIPMFSAILGGSIWLRLQIKGAIPPTYSVLSDLLVVLLTVLCVFMTLYNLWAWWGYRQLLARITADSGFPAQPPSVSSAYVDGGLCLAMGVACGMFLVFNPFKIDMAAFAPPPGCF